MFLRCLGWEADIVSGATKKYAAEYTKDLKRLKVCSATKDCAKFILWVENLELQSKPQPPEHRDRQNGKYSGFGVRYNMVMFTRPKE